MASKDVLLKKRLIKNAIVMTIALLMLLGGAYWLSTYDDSMQAEQHQKEDEGTRIRSEHDSIQQELGAGFETGSYYENYIRFHNADFQLKRETATQVLAALREKFHFTNLSVIISPVTELTSPGLTLKTGTLVKSDIHLTFGGLTDSSVYGFIESLQRSMPGIVIVNDVKINRTAEMSRSILTDLSQHRLTPMISAEVVFVWIGIRSTEDKSNDDGNHGK